MTRRLVGVDATRGVALLGMMAVHVLPTTDGDGSATTSYLVAGGRSAATFALLAGVGLALSTGGARGLAERARPAARVAIAIRALAIGVVGLYLGFADSGLAVILPYYAVLFVLALPLLGRRPTTLGVLALGAATVVPAVSHVLRAGLPPMTGANPTIASLQRPVHLLLELTLTGYYPALAWMTYLCAGLAAGRLRLHSPRVAVGLLAGGTALAAAASLASWVLLDRLGGVQHIAAATPSMSATELAHTLSQSQYGTTDTTTWWWLALDAPHSSTPFDLLHTTGAALALLGALLLLARVAGPVLRPLAAAGSMTLTLYSVHVVVMATPLLPADPLTSYLVQVAAALGIALVWRARFRRGPLEEGIAALAAPARRTAAER